MIQVKSIFEKPDEDDGFRVLVEPVWPRKAGREKTRIDLWLRGIAPSPVLAARFADHLLDWEDFLDLYNCELDTKPVFLRELQDRVHNGGLTLLHGSADPGHNAAVALRQRLEEEALPGSGLVIPASGISGS